MEGIFPGVGLAPAHWFPAAVREDREMPALAVLPVPLAPLVLLVLLVPLVLLVLMAPLVLPDPMAPPDPAALLVLLGAPVVVERSA